VKVPWWRNLWFHATWWRTPLYRVVAVDQQRGVVTVARARWSWRRWRWETETSR
jgi:hypothetical protein